MNDWKFSQQVQGFEKKAGIPTKDVFTGYINGSQENQSIIDEVTSHIAQGLYSISCLLDPHNMVFGGSVIVNNPFLLELIKEKLKVYQILNNSIFWTRCALVRWHRIMELLVQDCVYSKESKVSC